METRVIVLCWVGGATGLGEGMRVGMGSLTPLPDPTTLC